MAKLKTILASYCVYLWLTFSVTQAAKLDSVLYAKYLCDNKENNFRALVPGSCSQYYECQNGKSELRACPCLFDALSQKCITKDTICLTNSASDINAPAGCNGPCCGILNGFALDPIKQQVYYECKSNSVVSKNTCKGDLIYNFETLKCILSESCGEIALT